MSDYTPKTWADGQAGGTPITAVELNRIEQGVKNHKHPGSEIISPVAAAEDADALGGHPASYFAKGDHTHVLEGADYYVNYRTFAPYELQHTINADTNAFIVVFARMFGRLGDDSVLLQRPTIDGSTFSGGEWSIDGGNSYAMDLFFGGTSVAPGAHTVRASGSTSRISPRLELCIQVVEIGASV